MTVLRHTGINVGGVNPIQYAFLEDIHTFTVNSDTLIGVIAFMQGKTWNYLYASPDSIQIEGKEEDTKAGMKYTYQIKMLIPKDRTDVEIILRDLNERHLIINAVDKNGMSRYFGTLQSPMKKISKLVKPAGADGYQGWEVVFSGEFSQPSCYSSATSTDPITPPDPIE